MNSEETSRVNLGVETKDICGSCIQRKSRSSIIKSLTISCLLVLYLHLGGYMFLYFEGNVNSETAAVKCKSNLSGTSGDRRLILAEKLWLVVKDSISLYKDNWIKTAEQEILNFEKSMLKYLQCNDESPEGVNKRWRFAGCILYALNIATNIDYGHLAPKSTNGKIAAIIYSGIGIPLTLLYMTTIGDQLAQYFKILYSKVSKCWLSKVKSDRITVANENHSEITPFQVELNIENSDHDRISEHHNTRVPILLGIALIILHKALGNVIFYLNEKWSLLDGCYFSFSSYATLGLGNIRSGSNLSTVSEKNENVVISICCAYILLGLPFNAMCYNLMQDGLNNIEKKIKKLLKSCAMQSVNTSDECLDMFPVSSRKLITEPSVNSQERLSQVNFKFESNNLKKFNSFPRMKSQTQGEETFQRIASLQHFSESSKHNVKYFEPKSNLNSISNTDVCIEIDF